MKRILLSCSLLSAVAFASAQSFNLDFTINLFPTLPPSSSYGAAGQTGFWHNYQFELMAPIHYPLTDIATNATSATLAVSNNLFTANASGPWSGADETALRTTISTASPRSTFWD